MPADDSADPVAAPETDKIVKIIDTTEDTKPAEAEKEEDVKEADADADSTDPMEEKAEATDGGKRRLRAMNDNNRKEKGMNEFLVAFFDMCAFIGGAYFFLTKIVFGPIS